MWQAMPTWWPVVKNTIKRTKDSDTGLGLSPNPISLSAVWPSVWILVPFLACDSRIKIPNLLYRVVGVIKMTTKMVRNHCSLAFLSTPEPWHTQISLKIVQKSPGEGTHMWFLACWSLHDVHCLLPLLVLPASKAWCYAPNPCWKHHHGLWYSHV